MTEATWHGFTLQELRALRDRLPVVPDPENFRTVTLRDGSTGYYVRSGDDCFAAALSTVLQTPVPRFDIDGRLRRGVAPEKVNRLLLAHLDEFVADYADLRAVAHETVPVDCDRWIGVVPSQRWFQSHCLVMCRGDLLFDPVQGAQRTIERLFHVDLKVWDQSDIKFGLTFE